MANWNEKTRKAVTEYLESEGFAVYAHERLSTLRRAAKLHEEQKQKEGVKRG